MIGLNAGYGVREGDEFIVKFKANTTIPTIYIAAGEMFISNPTMIKSLQNVSEGEIKFKASKSAGANSIVFDFRKNGQIIAVTMNYTVYHINSYSPLNPVVALLLLSIFIPFEYYWRKRKIISID